MRKYEFVLILNPNTDEEARNELLERFKGIIESNGSIINVDDWGIRKLAYEINDLKEGYYTITSFEGGSDVLDELNRICKITESVIRHMIVKDEK